MQNLNLWDIVKIDLDGKEVPAQVMRCNHTAMDGLVISEYDFDILGESEPRRVCGIPGHDVVVGSLVHVGSPHDDKQQKLIQCAVPLMRLLAIDYNPHSIVIVSSTSAELYSGELVGTEFVI